MFIELFYFRRLLLVSDPNISRNFDRYLRQHQTNHFAVCFSQGGGNRVGVDVYSGSNICMSQEFLLHLEIDVERMKQRRMAMSPSLPQEQASFPECGLGSRMRADTTGKRAQNGSYGNEAIHISDEEAASNFVSRLECPSGR